eukprot:329743-Pyramimonas_sp.AAC.1
MALKLLHDTWRIVVGLLEGYPIVHWSIVIVHTLGNLMSDRNSGILQHDGDCGRQLLFGCTISIGM